MCISRKGLTLRFILLMRISIHWLVMKTLGYKYDSFRNYILSLFLFHYKGLFCKFQIFSLLFLMETL